MPITWFCHKCNSGPYNIATQNACTNVQCDHQICDYCMRDGVRKRDNRNKHHGGTSTLGEQPSRPSSSANINSQLSRAQRSIANAISEKNTHPLGDQVSRARSLVDPSCQSSRPHLAPGNTASGNDASLLSSQLSNELSQSRNPALENRVTTVSSSAIGQLPQAQLISEQPWLPLSECPCWPYSEQYMKLQRSLTSRLRHSLKLIRTCHILIFLSILVILGSLIPALWRSIARDDIQGGFSLAQYILGVGVFVIGCIVAIHSRKCTCWQ